jgi:hypothetical protein
VNLMMEINLFNSLLFFYILFYSILFYSTLFYSIPFYSILFYSILFYSIIFYSILFYSSSCFFIFRLQKQKNLNLYLSTSGSEGGDGILELVEEVEEAADLVEDETPGQEEVVEKLKVSQKS